MPRNVTLSEDQFQRNLYCPDLQNSSYLYEPKSPISPWLIKKISKQTIRSERKNNQNTGLFMTERTQEFLKKIKQKNRHNHKGMKFRHKTDTFCSSEFQEHDELKIHQKPCPKKQKEQQNNLSMMFFPNKGFPNGRKKLNHLGQKIGNQKRKTTQNFHTVKSIKLEPCLDIGYRSESQRANTELYSPEKSLAVSTIYKRMKKTIKSKEQPVDKFNNTSNQISKKRKKMKLQDIYSLVGININNNIGEKQFKMSNQMSYRNEVEKPYNFNNNLKYAQLKLTKQKVKPRLSLDECFGACGKSRWLIPRQVKNKKSLCKTVYI